MILTYYRGADMSRGLVFLLNCPAFLVFTLVGSATTDAQIINFTDDQFVIVASASPDSTFIGGDGNTSLTIDQQSGDFGGSGISYGLLRFLDFTLPVGAGVRSATLNFYTVSATDGPVNAYRMTTDWDATTTWNSLGGDGLTPAVETRPFPDDFAIDIVENETVSFDVTDSINAWLEGADNFGFGMFNESGDGWDVRTVDLEGEHAPTLTVELEVPPPVKLQVNPATGDAQFVSVAEAFNFELRSYQILNPASNFVNSTWDQENLAAQGIDASDPNASGQHWDTVLSNPDSLMESYLLGGSELSPGEVLPIGQIFEPFGPGENLPELEISIATSNFLGGADPTVSIFNVQSELLVPPTSEGDFNQDGKVDGSDFLLWQRGGSPNSLGAADLAEWQANYGAPVSAATAAVPEPTSLVLIFAAGLLLPSVRTGRGIAGEHESCSRAT